MELINHPEAFRAYLEALPESSPVGYRRNALVCPLATWVKRAVGLSFFAIEGEAYLQSRRGNEEHTPFWAALFIEIIDSVRTQYEVNRGQALAALDEAERQSAQLLLPEKCESLIRCEDCQEPGRVWVTLYEESGDTTFHLCWPHFTERFPVQKSAIAEPEPIGV